MFADIIISKYGNTLCTRMVKCGAWMYLCWKPIQHRGDRHKGDRFKRNNPHGRWSTVKSNWLYSCCFWKLWVRLISFLCILSNVEQSLIGSFANTKFIEQTVISNSLPLQNNYENPEVTCENSVFSILEEFAQNPNTTQQSDSKTQRMGISFSLFLVTVRQNKITWNKCK